MRNLFADLITYSFLLLHSTEFNKNKEYVIKSANKFLNKSFLPSGYCPNTWKIRDIDSNGNLRIENETQLKVIRRF